MIIWSPGYDTKRKGHPIAKDGETPHFLDWLFGHGWDIFYMQREGVGRVSERPEHADAIIRAVRGLRDEGYRRIVLAGQSAGGIYQMMAARADLNLYAMLLFASGPTGRGATFEDLLEGAEADRFLIAHFAEDDKIGPRDRMAIADIMSRKGRPAILLHEPFGMNGHGAVFKSKFARQYSDCILLFLDPHRPPTGRECDDVMQAAEIRRIALVGSSKNDDRP